MSTLARQLPPLPPINPSNRYCATLATADLSRKNNRICVTRECGNMTNAVVWLEEETSKVWAAADSLITVVGAGAIARLLLHPPRRR